MPPRRPVSKPVKQARPAPQDIYEDLIVEATSGTDFDTADERPLKRRKAGPSREKVSLTKPAPASEPSPVATSGEDFSRNRFASATPDASDDDLAFEDVELEQLMDDAASDDEMDDVRISLGQQTSTPTSDSARRRNLPRTDKNMRVLGHKAHVRALLMHCMLVNDRCNSADVQKIMRQRLGAKTRALLRPSREHTQFQQDLTFTDGLKEAVNSFNDVFEVTSCGLRRAYWPAEGEEPSIDADAVLFERKDFVRAARSMRGSQDVGNQLFCAMMRSAGVKARIVCSLQVLPLANTLRAPTTPAKPPKQVVLAIASDVPLDRPSQPAVGVRDRIASRHRISRAAVQSQNNVRIIPQKKQVELQSYPVYWVEVLNTAYQKWMPVDAVVTGTIGKASKIEPPAAYNLNQLSYAVAFSKDGSAKDVTLRYARSFNAKTRRLRVESIGEDAWWRSTMKPFKRRRPTDTDRIEDAELIARLSRERLPNNIQDFKGHPVYALERHLRRNEVIHPRQESGKVNAGSTAAPKMELVFRRAHVHVCHSAEQWYRRGQVIRAGEQPVKLVPERTKRDDSEDEGESEATALYMLQQTELYIPEPVVRGRVPRNNFGNLDVYMPSMVPKGGAHMRHPLSKQAAEILSVDAVDAVTGFKFSGRKGTPVLEGVIIPEKYVDAINEVIEGLLWQEIDERSRARSVLAMRLWKRFLQGLRIAERVQSYATEPIEQIPEQELTGSTAWYADDDVPLHTAGKYYLDDLVEMAKQAKKVKPPKARKRLDSDGESQGGGFIADESEDGMDVDADEHDPIPLLNDAGDYSGGFVAERLEDFEHAGGLTSENNADNVSEAGGFIAEDESTADAGGFLLEDESTADAGGFLVDPTEAAPAPAVDLTVDTPPITISSASSQTHTRPQRAQPQRSVRSRTQASRPMTGMGKMLASDSDIESLASHDPEDDDAEPDWMDSD